MVAAPALDQSTEVPRVQPKSPGKIPGSLRNQDIGRVLNVRSSCAGVVCVPQPSKWIALRAMIVLRYVGCIGAGRQTRPVLTLIERGIEFVLCRGVHGGS